MVTVKRFCDCCRKETEQVRYVEDEIFDYDGVDVPYEASGYVCCKCGEENYDDIEIGMEMMEIEENYKKIVKGY
jgi:hypothetical protein